jgi:hypothetical protein
LKRKKSAGLAAPAKRKRQAVKRAASKIEKRSKKKLPLRDAKGRFIKKTPAASKKRGKPQHTKKPAKKPTAKKTINPTVVLNGVRLGATQGVPIGKRLAVSALIALTTVAPARALVTVNARIVVRSVTLRPGDLIEVRQRRHPKKTPRVKPDKPQPVKKLARERLKSSVIAELPPARQEKGESEDWAPAYAPEWRHMDGTSAAFASHVRLDPGAAQWLRDYRQLVNAWGEDSDEVMAFADTLQEHTKRPIGEVWTLFFSP